MWHQLYEALAPHWHELGGISYLLLRIWLLRRQKKWQHELLARQRQQYIDSQNETVKIMSTAYASEEPQTLEDLLSRVERDWSLQSSERQSIPPEESSYNRLRRTPSNPHRR
jgi:hypothetical protein